MFSKSDMTNWSYILFKITEFFIGTIAGYRIGNLPEIYNESLTEKDKIAFEEYKAIMKALSLNKVEVSLATRAYTY